MKILVDEFGVGPSRFFLGCSTARRMLLRMILPLPMNRWWPERAACAGAPDPDLWFSPRREDLLQARAICASCPVRRECLAEGLFDSFGMRGGYTRNERIKMINGMTPIPEEMKYGEQKPKPSGNTPRGVRLLS